MEKRKRTDLINQDNIRKTLPGNRTARSISFSDQTWNLIGRVVETGRGKFGSPFIEHGARLFLAALSGTDNNIEIVLNGLRDAITTPHFSENLRKIADKWDEGESKVEL